MNKNKINKIPKINLLQHHAGDPTITLTSDLAGEFPLYLYMSDDKKSLLYSTNITELLNDMRVQKPLRVSNEGVSFLLQSGVVPPPKTAYENLFIVSIGDTAQAQTVDGKIQLTFTHEFPFLNAHRLSIDEMTPDEDLILQMLAEATISRIDPSCPCFLFHSAGKDSNSIALALADAGWQDKVTLITHKSKGVLDESVISVKIAKQLGFKHRVLHEIDQLDEIHKQAIEAYFVNAPFPCTDSVSLAYPLYSLQLPELNGANIIDGMGNDVFIGHIPSALEDKKQKISRYLKRLRILSQLAPSTSLFHAAGKCRSEHTGLSGFSLLDTKSIYSGGVNTAKHWQSRDNNLDYLDFRASVRGKIIDQEVFLRKVRNFGSSVEANLVLPWTNQAVAQYFASMPEAYLFDRQLLRNKLILRKMLQERIGLDSDQIGKMGFTYDKASVIQQNWVWVRSQIVNCSLWRLKGLQRIVTKLKNGAGGLGRNAVVATGLLNRLFLISIWHNKNKYLINNNSIQSIRERSR
jgi:asparagine synthase (glutamine-hydrolysing)